MIRTASALTLALLASPALAVECERLAWQGTDFTICEVDPAQEPLRLFLADESGATYGSFGAIEDDLGPLSFAMNAGMYHRDHSPVGHYVEDGEEVMRVIPNAGPGNFGMLPNGIFCIRNDSARVYETGLYLDEAPDCRHATQSGPMLVIDGALHPRFIEGSDSRHIRNGVGTSDDGSRVVFAISDGVVNFHDFATLFRDRLDLPQALYFDGKVSRLHAPGVGRSDVGWAMGPVVGVLDEAGHGG
ncbi:hypothetical protein OG2516_10226 [Oceanicola granulosus HTCC2516]|uniref:Phosphodiester glycosidase domain-containing protein n=1 Tax=Oceanicola granulosus (strain ATCC BAA-861 / DSM 15982 / KCTC 12143 / HTCC2516) TaxID=314256 RepID=Q2CKF8_OCEGH|nr:phosphodiester glycosidase family protein [Oceanicola granulosus]EAR52831.1 hypothetical protein OG2516_10226 [Oceanicola granulosus HTCC2516]